MQMENRKNLIDFEKADIMNGESTVIFGLDLSIDEGDFVYIVGKVKELFAGKGAVRQTLHKYVAAR